jgi:hypothetical protein
MSSRSVSSSIVADFLQGLVHTIAGGSTAHQPASGPAPTNVGQAPQVSVTVILAISGPGAVRRTRKLVCVAPAGRVTVNGTVLAG